MSHCDIVDSLHDSEDKTYTIGIQVQQTITNQAAPDARVLAFYNLATVVRFPKICFLFLDEYMNDDQWWVPTYLRKWGQRWPVSPVRGSSTDMIIHNMGHGQGLLRKDFKEVLLIGYTQALFSVIDSKFRLFTVALDPNACDNGTASFFKIFGYLLDQIGKKQKYEDFLKFFSYVRNTIHNNGLYKNKDFPHVSVPYRGTTYNFDYDQPFRHPDVQGLLYLEITPDVIDMMEDIILQPRILGLSSVPDLMA